MIGSLKTVVFDAPDHRALAAFYAELLGGDQPGGGANWRVYADPAAHPFCLVYAVDYWPPGVRAGLSTMPGSVFPPLQPDNRWPPLST